MARPFAPPIIIASEVYPILEKIINSGKEEKRMVERALFIVRMGTGKANRQIGIEFKVQGKTVKKWRQRWLEKQAVLAQIIESEQSEKEKKRSLTEQVRAILSDGQRSGAPLTYTAEQYCQILQVALEPPVESGRPINDWTSWELAEEVNKRGICENISASQVGRFLKKKRI